MRNFSCSYTTPKKISDSKVKSGVVCKAESDEFRISFRKGTFKKEIRK